MDDYLSPSELETIADAIAQCRTRETLVANRWSVPPLNRDPEMLGTFPKEVTLRDVSLRTIQQVRGEPLDRAKRRRLTELLVEAGVRSFQLAWLVSTDEKELAEEVRFLKALQPDAETTIETATRAQAQVAANAGVDVYTTFVSALPELNTVSGVYSKLIRRAHANGEDWRATVHYPKSEAEEFEIALDDIAFAKSLGLRASLCTGKLHYATETFVQNFAALCAEARPSEVKLNEGASGLTPETWKYVVRKIRSAAPDTPVATHTHNAFGLASACAIAAISAGSQIAEVSINHVSNGTGHADLAEVAAALEVLYGIDTGVNLSCLTPLARLVEEWTGVALGSNHPITGTDAFRYPREAFEPEELYAPVHRCVDAEVFGNQFHAATWM